MEEVRLQGECVFFGERNEQHRGSVWKANHGLRCHLCLTPGNVNLKDSMPFAYGDLMQRDIQNKRQVLLSYVDPLYLSNEKGGY